MTVCFLANGFLFCENITIKDGDLMRNWKERLVKCGIPEKIAQKIIDYYFKRRRTVELIAYVRMTEEATGRTNT